MFLFMAATQLQLNREALKDPRGAEKLGAGQETMFGHAAVPGQNSPKGQI